VLASQVVGNLLKGGLAGSVFKHGLAAGITLPQTVQLVKRDEAATLARSTVRTKSRMSGLSGLSERVETESIVPKWRDVA